MDVKTVSLKWSFTLNPKTDHLMVLQIALKKEGTKKVIKKKKIDSNHVFSNTAFGEKIAIWDTGLEKKKYSI